jgi:hypothetical protein
VVAVFLSPKVEKRGRVGHLARAARAGPAGSDYRLLLKTGQYLMSQADRDSTVSSQFLDTPVMIRSQKESLGEHSRLAGQSRSSIAQTPHLRLASSLKMNKESWELHMGVAEPIDGRNAILLKNLSRLRRRLPRDEQEGALGVCIGLLHDLPCSGGICPSPDLNSDSLLPAGVPDHRVSAAAWPGSLGDNCQARDLPQHAQSGSLERPLYFHSFLLIHSASEYTIYGEEYKGAVVLDKRLRTGLCELQPGDAAIEHRERSGAAETLASMTMRSRSPKRQRSKVRFPRSPRWSTDTPYGLRSPHES